eukprot:CAMPEP_0171684238 /NCGR_PEP_ID=MMETSP0991-20121206/1569_1 /TAXON_ID=483369 /ORGANISM="non described non described, Strain CCMP2098" /LENGTH=38 /DNA_ID= /DNA_START= /DNA_END= /DNA_ORIENTATION=
MTCASQPHHIAVPTFSSKASTAPTERLVEATTNDDGTG